MLATPAAGPSHMPASTTTSGWSVNGTGVPGIGTATCDAAASAAAKPTMPRTVVQRERASECVSVVMCSVDPGNAEGHRIAAAETERREAARGIAVDHGMQQCRENTRAASADRMAERNRAAVHVDAIPVPREALSVRQRLRGERFVRFDEIEVADG